MRNRDLDAWLNKRIGLAEAVINSSSPEMAHFLRGEITGYKKVKALIESKALEVKADE